MAAPVSFSRSFGNAKAHRPRLPLLPGLFTRAHQQEF